VKIATVWAYRADLGADADWSHLVGYEVEATDGRMGTVDEASMDSDRRYLVVDTGFWIFGKKRIIPAGVIARVDHDRERVYVAMTKDLIRQAPDYDDTMTASDDAYFDEQASYYEPFGA
jgi:hypothetical protein